MMKMVIKMIDSKILLVDDEMAILQMVEMVLKKESFHHIYTASTAKEAIQLTKDIAPDFIVLDVMLPDMNGFDVCMKLREYTNAHILFLSA